MIKNSSIKIEGLHCADCVHKIEKSLSKSRGVHNLHLSFATGQLNVTYDPKQVSLPQLRKKVEDLGYEVLEYEVANNRLVSIHNTRFVSITLSGIVFTLGLLFLFSNINPRIPVLGYQFLMSDLLFVAAMVFGGYYVLKQAIGELLAREFAIEFLMVVAAVGAVLIGALPEAAAILFLFSVAELLESYAVERSRRSINSLISLTPKTVRLRKGARIVEVPVGRVRPTDVAVVRSGQYIGVDGTVLKGSSTVDQATITGEAMPVTKKAGDTVFAGTLNQEGTLDIKVTKRARDTTLAKIIKLVESAESNKAPTERFVDRFAKYYTPAVLLLAVMVVLVPTFIFHQPIEVWFYKALLLILISCPCALAISTPVAIVSAITSGAKNGVLFKGGVHIEDAAKLDTIAFDKTGTLTTGKPVVTDIVPLKGHSKKALLQLAASLECLSKHPLGDALVKHAEKYGVHTECVDEFKTVVGKGVHGSINGTTYYVGGKSLFDKKAVKGLDKYFSRLALEAKTVVLIGTKNEIIGIIAFADQVRETGKAMVKVCAAPG